MTDEKAIEFIRWALMDGRWVNGQVPRNFVRDEKWQAGELAIEAITNKRPHGEWIDSGSSGYYRIREWCCSNCKDRWITCKKESLDPDWRFCPHCGAEMEADNDPN